MIKKPFGILSKVTEVFAREASRDVVKAAKRQLTDRLLLVAVLFVFPCVYFFAFAYSLLREEHLFAYTAVAEQLTIQINREVSWHLSKITKNSPDGDAEQNITLIPRVVEEVISSSNISERAFLIVRDQANEVLFESTIGDLPEFEVGFVQNYIDKVVATRGRRIEVYRVMLAAPFQNFQVQFFVPEQSILMSGLTMEVFALFLLCAIVLVLFILRRSGVEQIAIIKRRSDFFKAISHELKTPLTGLRIYSELLSRNSKPDSKMLTKYSTHICRETERLSRLVESILQMTAVDMRTANNKPSLLSVATALDVIRHRVAPLAELSDFKFTLLDSDETQIAATVLVDLDALAAIFILLVENAAKYVTPEHPKDLVAGVRIAKRRICFYLRDFGPGLQDEEVTDIFSPFFRGKSSTVNPSGTGIGLAIAREIAKHMGGDISAQQMNPGAEFILSLASGKDF